MGALEVTVLHDQKNMFPTKVLLVFIRFKSPTKTQPTYKSMCPSSVWESIFLIEIELAGALKHSLLVVEILTPIIFLHSCDPLSMYLYTFVYTYINYTYRSMDRWMNGWMDGSMDDCRCLAHCCIPTGSNFHLESRQYSGAYSPGFLYHRVLY